MTEWETQVKGLTQYLHLMDTFRGNTDAEGIVLKRGETLFGTVGRTSLVETRRRGGHWVSGSGGFSIPVGSIGGRSIRYRVGATRGHYVQGEPTPTAIDHGSTFITSQRVVFAGASQTRECSFAKLIGYKHEDGELTMSLSNRQKATTIHYGEELEANVVELFELALATFRGTVADLRGHVAGLLDEAESHKPIPPG